MPRPAKATRLDRLIAARDKHRGLLIAFEGPDGSGKTTQRKLLARWLDVSKKNWGGEAVRVNDASSASLDKLAGYAAPATAAAAAPAEAAPPPEKKSKWGAWGKWYTWVAAGGVVALVVGLLIAQNVGDDKLKIEVSK